MGESKTKKIIIVGGGAAGFFCAIRAAERAQEMNRSVDIHILEASDSVLKKVRISGGGRCNVTHHCFKPRDLVKNYPRGQKELISVFHRFQPQDTVDWFQKRGVVLKVEKDGRMFPTTDNSQTIIDCFLNEARRLGVQVRMQSPVSEIKKEGSLFQLKIKDSFEPADCVMIATGSQSSGHRLAQQLGHTITELAPSLFSFKIEDPLLKDLEGLSFEKAHLKLKFQGQEAQSGPALFEQSGPLLITHWGLSGPAILKLSAWCAREMKRAKDSAELKVNWLSFANFEAAQENLRILKNQNLKSKISNVSVEGLPRRFWHRLLSIHQISLETKMSDLSHAQIRTLAEALFATPFQVLGKSRYKDEFVECGGVDLKEIDFKKMESRICPSLFFAGEVLDIDGITGGFNFQNAWSGAWIAAESMFL